MEKPTFKQQVDGFCKFLWNSEEKTLLGRGGKSWAEIGFFYLIYYICLSGFFAATIAVFYQTVDENKPKLQGDASLLKGNPGMGFQPMPVIQTTLLRIAEDSHEANKKVFNKTIQEYFVKPADEKNYDDCSSHIGTRDKGQACRFDAIQIADTSCGDSWGFEKDSTSACVIIKLNKIFGWIPKVADTKPEGLNLVGSQGYSNDMIYIQCAGENQADKENLGTIEYFPAQGFRLHYYPYKKQDNYQAPLVFVKFSNFKKRMGLMVQCQAYAENIEVDPNEKQGSVRFELLMDTE